MGVMPRNWSLLAILVLAGCDCGEGTTDPTPDGGPDVCGALVACGDTCCEAGEICSANTTCIEEASCTTVVCDGQCCDSGEQCDSGACTMVSCPTVVCGPSSACCAAGESCIADVCCAADSVCGSACCGSDELCDQGVCKMDCGNGEVGCGAMNECCAAGDICYLGACVTPGDPCAAAGCATRPDEAACPPGQVCDPGLGFCVPRQIDETCQFIPQVGQFDPQPLFTWGQRRERTCTTATECQTAETCTQGMCTPTWPHVTPQELPEWYQSTSIPMVTDLDGDCVPEIVFNTFRDSAFTTNGVLRAIRGDDGSPVWTVTDEAYRTDATANLAIGDANGDGTVEIYVAAANKRILAINADGSPRWTSDPFTGADDSGSVTIANLDGLGDAELVFGSAVYDAQGSLLFEGAAGRGIAGQGPIACIADLDGDDRAELIAGQTIYEFTGTVAGGDFAGAVRMTSTAPDGYCGIADLDGDMAPEIVLVAGGTVYVLAGQTAAVRAQLAIPGGGQGGAPNIADFDGDGTPDIGTAGASNYVVMRFANDALTLLWQAPTEDDSSSRTGSSVFDFDGDGRNEVVYNDEEYVRIYPGVEPDCLLTPPGAGCDGVMNDDEILFRDLSSSRTRTEYPVIADIDGDFKAEIVFSTSNEAGFLDPMLVADAGIEVWRDALDNWVATRPVWNQHAYHITNVGLLGEVPVVEMPSWRTFNSYRRNAQGERDTFCAPNLRIVEPKVDPLQCPDLVFTAFVVNEGCLGVGPGVSVALYDDEGNFLGNTTTTTAIAPGAAAAVEIRLENLGVSFSFEVNAVVDDDGMGNGANNECEEDDNTSDTVVAECETGV
jgi:hypothetical protein